MDGDRFIADVAHGLRVIDGAFRSMGIEPPTEIVLRNEQAERLVKAIKPSMAFAVTDHPLDPRVVCKIAGVNFVRARP